MSESGGERPGDEQPGDEQPARGWLGLLRDRRFGPFFFGKVFSALGIWIHNITAAVLAYELTESAFIVGLVSVAQFVPQLALAPLSGVLADRGNRRRQVIVGRFVVASGSGGMALWLVVTDAGPTADTAVILASSLVVGLGFVLSGPAMSALIPALVRRKELAQAVTLDIAPQTIARAAGPAIGVLIAVNLGEAMSFALAAACHVAFVVALVGIRVAPRVRQVGADLSVRAAFAFVRGDRTTLLLLVGVAFVGFGADPPVTLAPAVSDVLGYGTEATGTLTAAFGVGAGTAFFVLPAARRWLGPAGYGTAGLVLMGVGLLIVAPIWSLPLAVAGFVVTGIGLTFSLTSLSAQLQQRTPDEMRGRIMALWSLGYLGSRPIAAAIDGGVADLVSEEAALALAGVLMLGAAWLCRPSALGVPGGGVSRRLS